jgi:CRP-like cAMP-binding protein
VEKTTGKSRAPLEFSLESDEEREPAQHTTTQHTNLLLVMDSRAQKRENESNDGSHSSSLSSHLQQESKQQQEAPAAKSADYQTLFWVPLLFKTATNVENLIGEMLDLIQDFEYKEQSAEHRRSILDKSQAPRRRNQILGEHSLDTNTAVKSVNVVSKSEATCLKLQTVLHRHFLFSQLRDYELEDMIDCMQPLYVTEGEVIIRQGDLDGDLFYILEEGKCEIIINDESLGYVESGASFGDLALMYNCPRGATIVTSSHCTLWTIDRVFFRQAMQISSSNQNGQLTQFLSKISLFEKLGEQNLSQLARSLTKQSYDDGQYIIRQGDIGEQFYVIFKGVVSVSMTDDLGNEKFLINLSEGEVGLGYVRVCCSSNRRVCFYFCYFLFTHQPQ